MRNYKELVYTDFFAEIVDIAIYSFIEQFPAKLYPNFYNYNGTLNNDSRDFIVRRFTLLLNGALDSFDYSSVESIVKRIDYIKNI